MPTFLASLVHGRPAGTVSRRALLRGVAAVGAVAIAGATAGGVDAARRPARVRQTNTSTGQPATGANGTGTPGTTGASVSVPGTTGASVTNNTTGGSIQGQDNATTTNTSPGASVNCTVRGEVVVGGVVTQPASRVCT